MPKMVQIWLNQQQMAELFATSKPNISMHIANILKEKELYGDSVVKEFLTTAADGKNYDTMLKKNFVSSTRGQQERTQKHLQKNRMERC